MKKEQYISLAIPVGGLSEIPKTPLVLAISKEGKITLNPDVYPEIVEFSEGGSHLTLLEEQLDLLVGAMSEELLVQLRVTHQLDYQRSIDVLNCLAKKRDQKYGNRRSLGDVDRIHWLLRDQGLIFDVPMKCDSCEQKATVFYTQVADGKMKKTALCDSCAKEQGVTDPTGLLMDNEIIMGEGGPKPVASSLDENFPELEVASAQSSRECPTCSFTIEDYQKIGRLGCGDCYVAFGPDIEQRLPSLHKGLKHTGHFPEGLAELEQKKNKLEELQKQLDQAIEAENYEGAARLRDELNAASTAEIEEGEEVSS